MRKEVLKKSFNKDTDSKSAPLAIISEEAPQSRPPDPIDEVRSRETESQGLTTVGDLIITTGRSS